MKKVFFFLFLLPILCSAQARLTVTVKGVTSGDGEIKVAVYNDSDGFLKAGFAFSDYSVKASKGITQLHIDNLPEGKYALAIFHDENGNNKLDSNWLGIPKEPIGFSEAKMKAFGPPGFEECSFQMANTNREIQVLF